MATHPWYTPLLQAGKAFVELIAHLFIVIAILGGMRLLEYVISKLWGDTDHLFFGRIPISHVFDAADLAILAGFLTYGVYAVMAAYVRKS